MVEIEKFIQGFINKDLKFISKGDTAIAEMDTTLPPVWRNLLAPDTVLDQSLYAIFQPFEPFSPALASFIAANTSEARLVVDSAAGMPIGLLYKMSGSGEGEHHYLGGLPMTEEARLAAEQRLGISLPRPFVEFSRIHNGFLAEGVPEFGIRPAQALYYLSHLPTFDDGDFDYDPGRLLGFCGDGAGNEQCFSLDHPTGDEDFQTHDWDHETRQLTRPRSFWEFVTEFILGG